MDRYRSLLFVPGNKPLWFKKVSSYGTDAVILDLEDSVPLELKEQARKDVAGAIADIATSGTKVFVRINKGIDGFDMEDIETTLCTDLEGFVLPKVDGPEEIEQLSKKLSEFEGEKGLLEGSVKLLPILETALSMYFAYEIAICTRVIGITGLSSKNGDVERALGTQWTAEGLETLYMRSKVVMAARAANVTPIGGLWQDVHNLEGLKKSVSFNRQLGFDGELVLHPSNVEIINECYSPSDEEIAFYEGMIDAYKTAKEQGISAIMYKGDHIDSAHVKTAETILSYAKLLKR